METALILEPTAPVPVPPQVGGEARHDHDMPDAGLDPRIAAGANICFAGLVGLNRVDRCIVERHPKNPHATNASVSTTNTTTSTMSALDRF